MNRDDEDLNIGETFPAGFTHNLAGEQEEDTLYLLHDLHFNSTPMPILPNSSSSIQPQMGVFDAMKPEPALDQVLLQTAWNSLSEFNMETSFFSSSSSASASASTSTPTTTTTTTTTSTSTSNSSSTRNSYSSFTQFGNEENDDSTKMVEYTKLESLDLNKIVHVMNHIRTLNNYTYEMFQEIASPFYQYDMHNFKSPKTVSCNSLNRYHPLVRRILSEEEGKQKPSSISVHYQLNKGRCVESWKCSTKENAKGKKSKKLSRPPQSEGLCPYCKEVVFAELKNSTYLHHLNKQHGVFSNGELVPLPSEYGIYKREPDGKTIECVECGECNSIIPINEATSKNEKKLLAYLRHFSDEHKRGCKLDHKLQNKNQL